MTFSQAQGYEALPQQLVLEELSDEARLRLWDALYVSAWYRSSNFILHVLGDWDPILKDMHSHFRKIPRDEFSESAVELLEYYKSSILHDLPFNRVFDLFQLIMRHTRCPREFVQTVYAIFRECRLAYVIDLAHPITVLPAATEQEGRAILGAIEEFRSAGLGGAEQHIRRAGELLNGGDWAGAVRESINAVESVARQLDPDASKTLGPALKSLEKNGQLHPALKKAFSNLYGYTSDEEGIRHPLLDSTASPVSQDEAVFMLGACASFSSYLWRKYRNAT